MIKTEISRSTIDLAVREIGILYKEAQNHLDVLKCKKDSIFRGSQFDENLENAERRTRNLLIAKMELQDIQDKMRKSK